jgi:hypothetical protein
MGKTIRKLLTPIGLAVALASPRAAPGEIVGVEIGIEGPREEPNLDGGLARIRGSPPLGGRHETANYCSLSR